MKTVRSYFFGTLLSLFCLLLLFHLGCFFIFSGYRAEEQLLQHKRKRRISPSSPALHLPSSSTSKTLIKFSSLRSYLSRILSFRKQQQHHLVCPRHGQLISSSSDGRADDVISINVDKKAVVFAEHHSFSTRFEIYPCSACSEVLSKPQHLNLHCATKHSLSELSHADSGYNIVRIIFESGWKGTSPPVVHRILKIHNTGRALSRFEEYRDAVRSRAAARKGGDERCIADGNERLQFFCTTSLCSGARAGGGGGSCSSQYCTSCAIVRHGFAGKHAGVDGIATHATSWGAHVALPEELESEFAFLGARRAMLVCRVVAGRVAEGHGGWGAEDEEEVEEEEAGLFDSVVPLGRRGGGCGGEDELLVFSTRAVLPCFVIIYTA